MIIPETQKRKLRSTLKITLFGVIIGLFYPVFGDGFSEMLPFVNGFSIGLIGGLAISFLELEIFDPLKRRSSFIRTFALKTSIYFFFFALLIPAVMAFNESIYLERGYLEHIKSDEFQAFLFEEDYDVLLFYAFAFIGLIIFIRQINRKLGQGVLINYISGRFHNPKEVERIFMYLDIRSSTTIAEQLGEIRFHNFLHDFFLDITECILSTKGMIYTYVGDQVVVTWKMKTGLEKANCIMTYFHVKNRIKRLREQYLENYGFVPRFSTSFHCGKVIVGELGDVKSQIVYQGEVLYETSAIEKKFSDLQLQEAILISETLLNRITLPALFKAYRKAEIKGNEIDTLGVYTLAENIPEFHGANAG
ncbi:adenylate/guanylate cyclase domain-containing protein [Flavilitoribacter nigricans]|uniref:Guanylate cyclase domain-containing protein n=1 Tax=Flavilitoribacter nigricans (strain ATCC 23147 / DSM 23189 / NBRC 102662 / NCIMB 1420 / SS-2) TaxID=1122177 RepID=A0A2D0N321_FLAN2|nr:adenylate/guanylate cyclase domain-containing protein [Flavilitoribacter nigricans]PHN02895.1 hypothetical protein CRP01_29240 [Flavilitoribacter nigricans DSM 23189 = NBRC 102662]